MSTAHYTLLCLVMLATITKAFQTSWSYLMGDRLGQGQGMYGKDNYQIKATPTRKNNTIHHPVKLFFHSLIIY